MYHKHIIDTNHSSHLFPTSHKSSTQAAHPPQSQAMGVILSLAIGMISGCLTQIFVNPLSVVQTRVMTTKKSAAGDIPLSTFGMAAHIYEHEGLQAFFAGIVPAFILSSNPAIQFLVFDRLKSIVLKILQQHMKARPLSAFESFIIGAIAKIVATIVTCKLRISSHIVLYHMPISYQTLIAVYSTYTNLL